MKIIVDCRMKDKYIDYLNSINIECIKLQAIDNIYDEISSHVDIFCVYLDDILVCAENINLDRKLFNNIKYGSKVENGYPNSARYNICKSGKYVICNEKYIDESLKKIILNKNLKIISVKQGYAKCNILALNETNYITSDIGIKNKLENLGFNVLYMENENIKLLKRDGSFSNMIGFIGGATCIIENKVILFGDADNLKKGQAFREFVEKNGYELVDFKDEEIIDYGGIVLLS